MAEKSGEEICAEIREYLDAMAVEAMKLVVLHNSITTGTRIMLVSNRSRRGDVTTQVQSLPRRYRKRVK